MEIIKITDKELIRIQKIAYATWPETFKDILKQEQIDYMLKWMYNYETLLKQSENGHFFYIAKTEDGDQGFIGIEPNHSKKGTTKIHKIYVLPSAQGFGIGKKLIEFVSNKVKTGFDQNTLLLNVNRFNKATDFYLKSGFKIIKEENIEIGNGYLMEDYVMQKII